MKRGVHRVAAGSEAARRMAQAKGASVADDSRIPAATLERNRKIDEARAADLAARKARRAK
jgi:hypothetical protein